MGTREFHSNIRWDDNPSTATKLGYLFYISDMETIYEQYNIFYGHIMEFNISTLWNLFYMDIYGTYGGFVSHGTPKIIPDPKS